MQIIAFPHDQHDVRDGTPRIRLGGPHRGCPCQRKQRAGRAPAQAPAGKVKDIAVQRRRFHYEARTKMCWSMATTARPGRQLAFIGSTDGSKSTMVKLLMRFYGRERGRYPSGRATMCASFLPATTCAIWANWRARHSCPADLVPVRHVVKTHQQLYHGGFSGAGVGPTMATSLARTNDGREIVNDGFPGL